MKATFLLAEPKPSYSVVFLFLLFMLYTHSCFAFYDEFIDKHVRDSDNNELYDDLAGASASYAMSKAAARRLGATFTPRIRSVKMRRQDKAKTISQLKALLTKKHSKDSLNKALEIRKHMSGNTDVIDVYIALCLWKIGKEKEAESYSQIHLSEEKASKLHLHMLKKSLERHDVNAASKHLNETELSTLKYMKWKVSILFLRLEGYMFLIIILVAVILFAIYFKIRNYSSSSSSSNVKLKKNVKTVKTVKTERLHGQIRTPQTAQESKDLKESQETPESDEPKK